MELSIMVMENFIILMGRSIGCPNWLFGFLSRTSSIVSMDFMNPSQEMRIV